MPAAEQAGLAPAIDRWVMQRSIESLRELHREGATICMVTHDPRYAKSAERSIHLFDGRVVEEDAARAGQKDLEASGFSLDN